MKNLASVVPDSFEKGLGENLKLDVNLFTRASEHGHQFSRVVDNLLLDDELLYILVVSLDWTGLGEDKKVVLVDLNSLVDLDE